MLLRKSKAGQLDRGWCLVHRCSWNPSHMCQLWLSLAFKLCLSSICIVWWRHKTSCKFCWGGSLYRVVSATETEDRPGMRLLVGPQKYVREIPPQPCCVLAAILYPCLACCCGTRACLGHDCYVAWLLGICFATCKFVFSRSFFNAHLPGDGWIGQSVLHGSILPKVSSCF